MLAYPTQHTLPYRLNPSDYFEELRPLWNATRAHMGMITSCKIWTATKPRADGYSRRRIGGKDVFVHRLGWQAAYGALQDGLPACQFWRTPPSTNPMPLFFGPVQADNAAMVGLGGRATSGR